MSIEALTCPIISSIVDSGMPASMSASPSFGAEGMPEIMEPAGNTGLAADAVPGALETQDRRSRICRPLPIRGRKPLPVRL
ncbi:MAG: hypothetical protein RMK57_10230 [Bryobacterales bacterium]|nr:hypothetical protein [Bryobacteraceae bacterium]MDW8354893.1 hypothetical protein [Bryobacterales bacterium]